MAADGSVFLVGAGEEEPFDYNSVVLHLNSSGSLMWEWTVSESVVLLSMSLTEKCLL